MSKRRRFEEMIAERIELANSKTAALVARAPDEVNAERRQRLEDCGLAIARAAASLRELKAASHPAANDVMREVNNAWREMEVAVRQVTGEAAVTLVPPLTVPMLGPRPPN